jgi:hypothetical protein
MIALLMVALLVFLHGRTLLAAVVATLGALIKPTALLALPVFWRPWDWKLPLAVVATISVAYVPYLSVGSGVLGYLGAYLKEEGFSEGPGFRVVWLVEQLTGSLPLAGAVYGALAALVLAAVALAIGFRTDRSETSAIRSLNWLLIVFLALSTPHYPWYFLVLTLSLRSARRPRRGLSRQSACFCTTCILAPPCRGTERASRSSLWRCLRPSRTTYLAGEEKPCIL